MDGVNSWIIVSHSKNVSKYADVIYKMKKPTASYHPGVALLFWGKFIFLPYIGMRHILCECCNCLVF
jgi:hypothetical protein